MRTILNNIDLDEKVKNLVRITLQEKGLVSPVDILLQLGYLSAKDYDDWRFGRIEYLERAFQANLSKLTLINKTIRKYSDELKLKSSLAVYKQFGKGAGQHLRFSKSGDKTIEENYATHYVDSKRIIELKAEKSGE